MTLSQTSYATDKCLQLTKTPTPRLPVPTSSQKASHRLHTAYDFANVQETKKPPTSGKLRNHMSASAHPPQNNPRRVINRGVRSRTSGDWPLFGHPQTSGEAILDLRPPPTFYVLQVTYTRPYPTSFSAESTSATRSKPPAGR